MMTTSLFARRRAGMGLGLGAALLAGLLGCAAPAVPPAGGTVPLSQLVLPAAPMAAASDATATAPATPPSPLTQAPRYVLSVGDDIDVRVPDAPYLDQSLKVRPDGQISLPLVGSVAAAGRSPDELEAALRERLQALAGAPGERDYLLQPNDELEIKFPHYSQLNELMRIRPDGKLQLQLVGTVVAEGRSPEELRDELRKRYARYLKLPELSVVVRSFSTQNVRVAGGVGRAGLAQLRPTVIARTVAPPQVFVGGEVQRPGVLAYRPGLSLLQALIEAGGSLPTGDSRQLLVLRRSAGDQVALLRPGLSAQFMRRPDQDVVLQPYDVVLLPKSDAATLADRLNEYVFNLFPVLRNSSLGFSYVLRGDPNSN